MSAMTLTPSRARELLAESETNAWSEYLETTRETASYGEVEPWAWARLQRRLARIAEQRAVFAAAAGGDDGA